MDFPCIALLTDFGERDGFVGVMKGILCARIDAPFPIMDISHGIAPQAIRQGAWVLKSALPYFSPKTVFVAVVDPDVGSSDQASLLGYWPERQQIFIGPDNGLITPFHQAAGAGLRLYDIRDSQLYKDNTLSPLGRSQTFHGRDIYAPAAALVANALHTGSIELFLHALGTLDKLPILLSETPPNQSQSDSIRQLTGEIVYCDTFGNLITNIPNTWVSAGQSATLHLPNGSTLSLPLVHAYAEARELTGNISSLITVPSSGGTLEISEFQGNAQQRLNLPVGSVIRLSIPK